MESSNLQTQELDLKTDQKKRMVKHALALSLRKNLSAANRLRLMADGSRWIVRFTQVEILEHWLLLVVFITLVVTGFMQQYTNLELVAWMISTIFGGIGTLRFVHQIAAVVMSGLALFHLAQVLYVWLVIGEAGSLMPRFRDAADLFAVLGYNLGLRKERPQFGRFSIEEKLTYWGLLIFFAVMILTGLVLWFPTTVTKFLPGELIPTTRTVHSLTAILGTVGGLIWHIYHTLVRERNYSIFTGLMSERSMKESHSLEYRQIIAAHNEIQKTREEM